MHQRMGVAANIAHVRVTLATPRASHIDGWLLTEAAWRAASAPGQGGFVANTPPPFNAKGSLYW